jgi:hypothetical protein
MKIIIGMFIVLIAISILIAVAEFVYKNWNLIIKNLKTAIEFIYKKLR